MKKVINMYINGSIHSKYLRINGVRKCGFIKLKEYQLSAYHEDEHCINGVIKR